MTYEIKAYNEQYIESQVNLIWEITDNWKYPYQTSYDSVKQQYSADSFDPTTRFYAVDGDNLLGYVTSAVVKDTEKGDYGTMRFPLARNNDPEIVDQLFNKAENRFKEMGIKKIRVPAGVGMGDTMKLADKYGFHQKSTIFSRSKLPITNLKISGDVGHVTDFSDPADEESVRKLFTTKMGMDEKQGAGFFGWAIGNKRRKEKINKNKISWKIQRGDTGLTGFSYLHRSDHNSENGNFAPVYVDKELDYGSILDNILSAHVKSLQPEGLVNLQTYLGPSHQALEPFYNKLGFTYDPTYSYEKELI